jgi:hypothetical protein
MSATGGIATMRIKDRVLASAIIVAAAAFVYRAAASAYFFDDDFQWLVGTWAFQPAQLLDFSHMSHFYRPVIDLYFAAATPLFGGSPALFHLFNIGLHAANGLLLLALAREMSRSTTYAFLTALFFVVQPADVDAIAWVSALAEAVGAFFGCLALLWFLQFRRSGRSTRLVLSVAAFFFALLTHESSVMFLPLVLLAGWAFAGAHPTVGARSQTWTAKLRPYVPYAILLTAYLAIDLRINSRNYVVAGGHYGIGGHVVTNALEYIVALYVGRHDLANYLLISGGLTVLLLRGSRRVVFATAWLILALLPFVFFRWSNTSRYLYLPAMGFSMLVAEGVMQLDWLLASRLPRAPRIAVLALVAAAIAGRFSLFAVSNVRGFAERTEEYRREIALFKQVHGDLPSHSRVPSDPRLRARHRYQFLNALVQWEYRDPTIELIPDQPD